MRDNFQQKVNEELSMELVDCSMTGEQRLAFAVIVRAFRDALEFDSVKSAEDSVAYEAFRWLFDESQDDGKQFSFCFWASALSDDPWRLMVSLRDAYFKIRNGENFRHVLAMWLRPGRNTGRMVTR